MSARTLLVRGLLCGLLAGVLAFVVAKVLGESQVAAGIRFEQGRAAVAGEAPGPALVSRTVQSTLGLLTGCVVYGVAFGGLFSLAYGFAAGRLGSLSAQATAATVAVLALLSVHVLPALKYPPDPPGFTSGDTITARTNLYLVMLAISVVVTIGAVVGWRDLAPRLGSWPAALAALAGALLLISLAWALLPAPDAAPAGFDADVLWRFRRASSAVQVTTWATIGLAFGWLSDRSLRQQRPVAA